MSVYENVEIAALQGGPADLPQYEGKAVLIVNVASKCGLTPQYAALEQLHAAYAGRGFSVLGVPCNQFMGQEPGSAEEIAEFCSATYGVTFPMTEKVEVNGEGRHPLYERLVTTADAEGHDGDIRWNFEKFVLSPKVRSSPASRRRWCRTLPRWSPRSRPTSRSRYRAPAGLRSPARLVRAPLRGVGAGLVAGAVTEQVGSGEAGGTPPPRGGPATLPRVHDNGCDDTRTRRIRSRNPALLRQGPLGPRLCCPGFRDGDARRHGGERRSADDRA